MIKNRILWEYLVNLFNFNPPGFLLSLFLMILISFTEGVGLLLLIPLLDLVGVPVSGGGLGQIATGVSGVFEFFNLNPTLGVVLIIYVVIITANSYLSRWQSITSSRIQYTYGAYLRNELFESVTNSRWISFTRKPVSGYLHALSGEIDRIITGTGQFLTLLVSLFVLMVYIVFALQLSGPVAGLLFVVGVILLLVLKKKTRDSHEKGQELSTSTRQLYAVTSQHLEGMKTVKSFALEKENVEEYSRVSDSVARKFIETIKGYADVRFLFEVGSVVILSLVVYVVVEVLQIPTAELLVLLFLFVRIIPRFSLAQRSYQYFLNMLPAFSNVQKLTQECAREKEEKMEVGRLIFEKEIRFKDVSFSYDGSFGLRKVNLSIKKGEVTAMVGLSGAGKSTTADLVMGLITPDKGEITIDGEVLGDNYSWKKKIGYVAQDTFLFNDTIRNNLLLANKDATLDDLKEVLELSAATFVYDLPEGLDTVIGDRGVRLSGGERQRIALARALIRKPSLLILDEATSNLDSENEKKILESLERLEGKITVLLIAHRLSTLKNADYIYVLEDGQLVEEGTWNTLINKKGKFKSLSNNQGFI
ncbi:ABC transporter ATP-binding protein [Methanobacterium movens]